MDDHEAAVRDYYRTLDDHAYDDLRGLLAPGMVQRRPDRTFEGREAFVSFMRDDRPQTDTSHELCAVYADETGVAARGHLLDSGGDPLVRFVDVFSFDGNGRIAEILTYTR